MKKIGLIILAAVLMCFLGSCVSSGMAALRTQRDPIALVSLVSNREINWKGEEAVDPDKVGPITKRALRAEPGSSVTSFAEELIYTAENLFRDTMAGSGIIYLAEKEKVLQSRAYQEARLSRHQVSRKMATPAGYRLIDFRDKNFSVSLAEETGIQRSLYVEFDFAKAMTSGLGKNGNCQAVLDMTILVLDARGKTVLNKIYTLGSRDSIKVSSGVYSENGLMDLLTSAISDACYEFLDQLGN